MRGNAMQRRLTANSGCPGLIALFPCLSPCGSVPLRRLGLTTGPPMCVTTLHVGRRLESTTATSDSAAAVSTEESSSSTQTGTASPTCVPPPAPWCLRTALFGLCDMHTGPITYPTPQQRLATEMPLLPRRVRHHVRTGSTWFQDLERYEAGNEGEAASDETSPTLTDQTAALSRELSPDTCPALLSPPPALSTSSPSPPPPPPPPPPPAWHMAVVGRPKVLRYALVQYLRRPEYWFDATHELLERAFRHHVGTMDGEAAQRSSDWLLCTNALMAHPDTVALWSGAVVAALEEFVAMSGEDFHGPRALWLAHVVRHRQDAALLASPQRRPFSFGELRASLAPSDLEPRRVSVQGDAYAQTASDDRATDDSDHDASWATLTEREQNARLFGVVAANVAAQAVRIGPTGRAVYAVAHHEEPTPASTARVMAESGSVGASTEAEASTPDTVAAQQRQKEAAAEHRAVRRYRVDAQRLRIIEPSLYPESDATRALESPPASTDTALLHASGTSTIQTDALWKSFQATSSAVLLDDYVAVQTSLYRVQREVVLELAGQTAFLLLFFARDEVRLVTAPEQTSAHLWHLHQRLQGALHQLTTLDGMPSPTEAPAGDEPAPFFPSLPLSDALSFTCFGCAHRPHVRTSDAADAPARVPPLAVPCSDAAALYAALATVYHHVGDTRLLPNSAEAPTPPAPRPTSAVPHLTSVQSMALEMCYPRSGREVQQYRSYLPARSAPPALSAEALENLAKAIIAELAAPPEPTQPTTTSIPWKALAIDAEHNAGREITDVSVVRTDSHVGDEGEAQRMENVGHAEVDTPLLDVDAARPECVSVRVRRSTSSKSDLRTGIVRKCGRPRKGTTPAVVAGAAKKKGGKKCGRPRKETVPAVVAVTKVSGKKRGRPRKVQKTTRAPLTAPSRGRKRKKGRNGGHSLA